MKRRELLEMGGALALASSGGAPAAPREAGSSDVRSDTSAQHVIVREFERPDPVVLKRLQESPFGVLGIGSPFAFQDRYLADHAIRPISSEMAVFGTASTVYVPEPDLLIIAYATKIAQPGDVLVISAGGRLDIGVMGYAMGTSMLNKGLGGAVVDGAVVDSQWFAGRTEYAAAERVRRGKAFPVFAKGITGAWGGWEKPGSINIPVAFGGLVVHPGDLVVGDADGLMVIPRKLIPTLETLLAPLLKMSKELDWLPRLRRGELWFDILDYQQKIDELRIPEFKTARDIC